jgi:nitroreductase
VTDGADFSVSEKHELAFHLFTDQSLLFQGKLYECFCYGRWNVGTAMQLGWYGGFLISDRDEGAAVGVELPNTAGYHGDAEAWWNFTFNTSLANAFMSMQLAAASLGLGTQWVSAFRNPAVDKRAKELLGIPGHLKIYEMMAIGYPDIKVAPKKLRPLSSVVHYNRAENYGSDGAAENGL